MSTAIRPWAEFSKEEIIAIAKELRLESKGSSHDLVHLIDADLRSQGVPPEEECTELLDDYLFSCGYIQEDGSVSEEWPVIQTVERNEEPTTVVEGHAVIIREKEIQIGEKVFPKFHCFSLADSKDPACRKCKVMEVCLQERVKARPPCFGNYLATDEQCKVCIEALPCSQRRQENE